MFNIRVVTVDHYVSKPIFELYENSENYLQEWQEPVLRIFGSTPDGYRACVHLHGVYPYIYVPYKGGEKPDRDALLLGAALDEALKTTLNPKIFRYVFKVTLVSGIPLYGYHSKSRQFFKIYFYNPTHIRKASELLLSGGILGQKFQPHESHIPYTLQFMMDYNIYGMSFATFSKVKYRRDPENPDSMIGINEEEFLSRKVKKITCSFLEVDALASDIMNRTDQWTKGSNPGLRAIWEDERYRRRDQDRNSEITVQQSGSRGDVAMCPSEIMYKAQLAQKLKEISLQESDATLISDEPLHSYPAEVPENADLLEASAIVEGIEHSRIEENITDVSLLIDERILTQIAGSQEEKAGSEEEEGENETEADSVLGNNQKAEEEAELEEEEGVDMTQPLDLDEEVICAAEGDRDEPGDSERSEDSFWRDMADKIFQLDGAQESSSESESDAASSGAFGSQLELSSAWSGNIMSILSEDSGCPTPSTVCQTPRTFWSNYSPNCLPQSQDTWGWNKNCTSFSNQSDGLNLNDFSRNPKDDTYEDFFTSNDDEYFQAPVVTPLANAESSISPPSAVLTPASELDGSDINLDSICESLESDTTKEEKLPSDKFIEKKITFNRKPESDRQKFLRVLKSFAGRKEAAGDNCGQLTLKQYIKDCKEIVSVDFKNLCNKEMIIIEYKSENKKSYQNKYLIKPLDKFLESWNSAERKVLPKDCDARKIVTGFNVEEEKNLRSMINVLEKKFSDSSTVQSVSNKLTVKSMEILPDEGKGNERCYNVNQNLISQGKIKMKLIKSQEENLETVRRKHLISDLAKRKRKREEKAEKKQRSRSRQKFGRNETLENLSEPDTKLINEINSSFEEYFKSIVRRKQFKRKKRSVVEVEEEEDEDDDEPEDTSDCEKQSKSHKVGAFSNADSIKFVTRFLSTFSQMSDMPPLSITISLGNSRTSVPIQVNVQPSENKVFSKIQRKKMKVENVDGPADGSSSEDSVDGDFKQWIVGGKKTKRDSYYKPLNVIVSSKKKEAKSKRKTSGVVPVMEKQKEKDERTKIRRKSFSTASSDDQFADCREKPKSWPPKGEKKEKVTSEIVVKSSKNQNTSSYFLRGKRRISKEVSSSQSPDLDFIYDSEEEKRNRKPSKVKLKKIPQADTEAFTSSDDDVPKEALTKSDDESLELGLVNERSREKVEDGLYSFQKSRSLSPLETGGETVWEVCVSDDSAKKASLQETFSPFTLSGSPLLLSNPVSADSAGVSDSSGGILSKEKESNSQNSYNELSKWGSQETNNEAVTLDWVIGEKLIRPKKQAVSREAVMASILEGVFKAEENAPFYSDPRDVGKAVEAGPRVLKVDCRFVSGLKAFKSSLDIVGAEERRNLLLGNRKIGGFGINPDRDVCIVPLIKPPSSKAVLKWLPNDGMSKKDEKKEEKSKRTIVKPLSPGEDMGSDEEMELSVSIQSFSGGCKATPSSNTTKANDFSEIELGLKKGPLAKIKGIKRCLLKKLPGSPGKVPEEVSEIEPRSRSPVSSQEGKRNSDNSFQIRGVTLDNTFGFRNSVENRQNVKLNQTHQYMSMLVMELHVQTRKDLRPDPNHDPISALFYVISFDSPNKNQETGILVVGDRLLCGTAVSGNSIHYVSTEKELIEKLLALVKMWDPEILAGYEIEMHSWGYLVQRGFILDMNLLMLLGRVQTEDFPSKNFWDFTSPSDDADDVPRSIRHMRVSGRIVLDVWRLLRHEVALTSYTFENVMYNLSHERHPLLSYESLTHYWEHPSHRFRHLVVDHYMTRVVGVIRILDQLDFINRTSELSRLFGIQFYEVLSRGSQFRVESMMLRLAKPLNYVPASPSVAQRAAMRAPASLPLILEPESLFYSDPVIVLDFQSLYPSMIIAYNYCFSTCLGRIEKLGGREPFEFGCTQLQIMPEELKRLGDDISVSPAGVAFVKSNIRKGVLPTMLEEILETRLMVKKSMKENKENKKLEKVLFARQLGLKLIANVTYGYTAANFSGRMPCIELGDSVVSKGRETLHRAIQLVKNSRKWGAKVVYGDTDSIFVCTPGKSRDEAFKIGAEIAEAVTQDNPKPVKLKLEKVYQPCILQTKKRYVGYMFESPDQEKPVFEAKGIETVRRDGCPAIRKILEKALQILFDTRDVSLVKKYTIRQFAKLFQGHVNLQDLIFAKEYRGRKGYRPGACVPALQLAKQWTQYDRRAEPRVKERVPYVIVNGPPGVALIRLVRSPKDLISDPSLSINAVYYITKAVIPPMQRCFSLLGVDVTSWFIEMPRKYHKMYKWRNLEGQRKNTISQYFATKECAVCSEITNTPVCQKCETRPQIVVVRLTEEIRRWERCHEALLEICRSCCKRPTELDCVSLDCPVLFRRTQAARALDQAPGLREILERYA